MSSSSQSRLPMRILIAVDFGTTFSGVAYVKTTNHSERTLIRNWGDEVQTGEKVPTVLKYDRGDNPSSYRWGFQVEEDEKDKCEWFKLSLYDQIVENDLTRQYPIKTPEPNDPKSDQMVQDYLTGLREHVERYLRRTLRAVWFNTPKEWIITVPAVWTERSKARTLDFAKKAGMEPSNKIEIVAEPEAAGLFALETMRIDLDLNVGDTFVVCDAGGGTVDLVSYTVISLSPPAVVEAAPGSGGLCGASFLNRIFADYLTKKFANFPAWNEHCQSTAMQKFEKSIKQRFTGDLTKKYLIPVMLPNNPTYGIKDYQLPISGRDIKVVFEPVIKEIVKLVKAQIEATEGREVRAVLLAGGFGENGYLRTRLQSEVGDGIDVVKIEGSNTSIVRGALIRALSKVAVETGDESLPYMRLDSRIARKHYGTLNWEKFDHANPNHQPSRMEYDRINREFRIQVMHWFIKKGDAVKESKPEQLKYFVRKAVELGPLQPLDIEIYVYDNISGSALPSYKTKDVKLLVKLKADLGKIPPDTLEKHTPEGGKEFYKANYDIEMTLHSASLSFTLVHAGHVYPAVEAEFV